MTRVQKLVVSFSSIDFCCCYHVMLDDVEYLPFAVIAGVTIAVVVLVLLCLPGNTPIHDIETISNEVLTKGNQVT